MREQCSSTTSAAAATTSLFFMLHSRFLFSHSRKCIIIIVQCVRYVARAVAVGSSQAMSRKCLLHTSKLVRGMGTICQAMGSRTSRHMYTVTVSYRVQTAKLDSPGYKLAKLLLPHPTSPSSCSCSQSIASGALAPLQCCTHVSTCAPTNTPATHRHSHPSSNSHHSQRFVSAGPTPCGARSPFQ